MLPDIDADVTLIGQQHLDILQISRSTLQPPPLAMTFTADGSTMTPALGTFQVTLILGKLLYSAKIHVYESVQTPLLLYSHC